MKITSKSYRTFIRRNHKDLISTKPLRKEVRYIHSVLKKLFLNDDYVFMNEYGYIRFKNIVDIQIIGEDNAEFYSFVYDSVEFECSEADDEDGAIEFFSEMIDEFFMEEFGLVVSFEKMEENLYWFQLLPQYQDKLQVVIRYERSAKR